MARNAAETAYDTRLFGQEPEEESVENLTGALPDSSRPHHPVYDVIADTSRFPKQTPPAPQRQAAYTPPVTPAVPEAPFAAKPSMRTEASAFFMGSVYRLSLLLHIEKLLASSARSLELVAGFEPATCSLRVSCSAS